MLKNRHSIRLKNYDYSQSGMYFVTICTEDRKCIFGEIIDGKMINNDIGNMITHWLLEINDAFKNIELDIFQLMPNHLHTIIVIRNRRRGGPVCPPDTDVCPPDTTTINGSTHRSTPTGTTVGTVIQWFKTMTTNKYIKNINENNWERFNKRIWQRNYYEHIIRAENDLDKIREYIINNPLMWNRDRNNPENL